MSDLKSLSNDTAVGSNTAQFIVPSAAPVPTPETGKVIKSFEFGNNGDSAHSVSDGFSSGGENSFLDNTRTWSGGLSARCSTTQGSFQTNHFGGFLTIPNKVYKGQEIWFQIHAWFDEGFKWGGATQSLTKFMRYTTSDDGGHVDVYARRENAGSPFRLICETTNPAQQGKDIGVSGVDDATQGAWATYEFYMKADNIPVDEGGQGMTRFWKDGKLMGEMTHLRTLRKADHHVKGAILFTYWNGADGENIPPLQGCWIDDIIIQTSQPSDTDAAGNKMIGDKG